jgi:large subunit ribosomal protein L4e
VQEKRATMRQEKLAKLRAGKTTGSAKPKAIKAVGKAFYKSMIVESEYQGEDYDQFSNWLGTSA